MTAPIHVGSWLLASNESGAHFAFNRTLLAGAYGAFNVRNEVVRVVGGNLLCLKEGTVYRGLLWANLLAGKPSPFLLYR